MLQYDSMPEDSDGEEGPFLNIKLKDVKRLIQNHSASNSQNIENIKYFVDDHGVWRDLQTIHRFSKKQLESNRIAKD